MLYDQVEQCYLVLAANFATDYAALLTAKGVASPGAVTLIKRQSVPTALRYGKAPPFLGIVSLAAQTQAKDQSKRDNRGLVAFDFYQIGSDPEVVAQQSELAAEAVLMSVDRFNTAGGGLFGGGDVPQSVDVTMSDDEAEEVQLGLYGRRATVSVRVWDRDSGL